MHKDIVFCLEYKHIVKSTRDTKSLASGEENLDRKDKRGRLQKQQRQVLRVSNADPGLDDESSHSRPMYA